MQSEDFDNKIRQAADHHHPTYDEQAWGKMEKLLDKHLPQKKDDNRRFIFFLMFFLLVGGGATFLFFIRSGQAKQTLANKQNLSQENRSINSSDNSIVEPAKIKQTVSTAASEINPGETENKILQSPLSLLSKPTDVFINKKTQSRNIISNDKEQTVAAGNTPSEKINTTDNNEVANDNVQVSKPLNKNNSDKNRINPIQENNIAEKNVIKQKEQQIITANTTQPEDKNTTVVIVNPVSKSNKNHSAKSNSFFISFSTAPDVSGAMNEKSGKMKLTTGAGIGYTFHDKFTLRTGFYTGRKVYSATPGEYHPPASFWNYYPNLEKVDADCRVYEIPVLLSYNFGNSFKQSWSATAGLSSYLMKRETYDYTYKNQWGQSQYKSWTIYDENKHYFSVLTLSAGYQRNFSNSFFIAAEPYVKLPLTGLGYGKIKLNSAGIQLSAGVKLFGGLKKQGTASH